jgi:hypothetical protein
MVIVGSSALANFYFVLQTMRTAMAWRIARGDYHALVHPKNQLLICQQFRLPQFGLTGLARCGFLVVSAYSRDTRLQQGIIRLGVTSARGSARRREHTRLIQMPLT